MNALQLCRRQFSHKEILQQTFFMRIAILHGKSPFCVFEPPFGCVGAMYDDHFRLIWKRVVYFLLVLIEFFFARCYGKALQANIDWKSAISLQRGQFDSKYQVQWVALTNHSCCHKTRVNDLSCGIRMRAQLSFVLSQITRLTDRQNSHR